MNSEEAYRLVETTLKGFGLSNEHLAQVRRVIRPSVLVKKGQAYIQKGKVCDKIGILLSGILYASFEAEKKNEPAQEVSRFYFSGHNILVTSFESFKTETKAKETIKALEDSYLFEIGKKDLMMLYDDIPQINWLGRELAEESYIQALQRTHDLKVLSPKKRFEDFYGKHKDLIISKKLQAGHIASYLGFDKSSISKFMKEIVKK